MRLFQIPSSAVLRMASRSRRDSRTFGMILPDWPAHTHTHPHTHPHTHTHAQDTAANSHVLPDVPPSVFMKHAEDIIDAIYSGVPAAKRDALRGLDMYTGVCGIAHTLIHAHTLTQRASMDTHTRAEAHTHSHAPGAAGDGDARVDRASRAYDLLTRYCFKCVSTDAESVPTFLCGAPGVYACMCACAHALGQKEKAEEAVRMVEEVGRSAAVGLTTDASLPCEMLYGRAGYLYTLLYVDAVLGTRATTHTRAHVREIIEYIVRVGRAGGVAHGKSPLMFAWHGKKYIGAAHGVAGICHILLHFPLAADVRADVLGTLRYLIATRYASGNYPSHDGAASADDLRVQWCHGATGLALTLCKAYEVTGELDFLAAARDAGEVVWSRGLLRRLSLCHGIAGNLYVFLALYRTELLAARNGVPSASEPAAQKWLHRAKAFGTFLLFGPPPYRADASLSAPPVLGTAHWQRLVDDGEVHGGDRAWSLFEGAAGVAYALMDLAHPDTAAFPGFEIPPQR